MRPFLRHAALFTSLCALGCPAALQAAAPGRELHRCAGADGSIIFTDQRCADLDAVDAPRPAAPAPTQQPAPVRVRSCARNQDDLLFGVRSALENRDVNRLADYYHWTGLGNAEGYRLLDRLDRLSARPLLDVQLQVAERAYDDLDFPSPFDIDTPRSPEIPARPPRPAHSLRIDQMVSDRDFSTQVTVMRLRSHAGCWWLQF